MAPDPNDVSQLNNATKAQEQLAAATDATAKAQQHQAEITGLVSDKVGKGFLEAVKNASGGLLDFMTGSERLGGSLGKMDGAVANAGTGLQRFAAGTGNVAEALLKLGGTAMMVGSGAGRAIISPVGEMSAGFELATVNVGKHTVSLANLNQGLHALIDVQTVAREAIVATGGSLGEANAAAEKYPQTLRNMSAMFGISGKALGEMGTQLRGLPGMMMETSGSITGISSLMGSMIQPAAVLATTMRAFGMTTQQSAEFANKAALDFGRTTEQTFKDVGMFAGALEQAGDKWKKMGLTGKLAEEQIVSASQSLAIFGQGSAVAASTWTTFANALEGSGVPLKNIGEMVSALTGSFANMQLQTKAAIATFGGLGGGRTALGGALQMEMNMRTPGGLEKNLEAMTSTLGKFGGGKIITLEEAAGNPQLEAQFVVQRQMLGKLTGISNTEQQNRILETMQNVQRGGMSQVEGGQALERAMEKGKDVQTQSLTFLEQIAANTKASIGGATDKTVGAIQKALMPGLAETGRGLGEQGARGVPRATPRVMAGARKTGAALRGVPETLAKADMGMAERLSLLGGIGTGIMGGLTGKELGPARIPEARLATHPVMAATPRRGRGHEPTFLERTAMAATRPSESPMFKIVDVMQKRDDTKIGLMEQMLTALQQKTGRELPPAAMAAGGHPAHHGGVPAAAGATEGMPGGRVITVRVVGDENEITKVIEDALRRKSTQPLGYTNTGT